MRIFNKFVQSVKEPSNKNDIWFDGSVFRLYKQGSWTPITLTQEAIDRLIEYINGLNIYVIVDALPEKGEKGKIYILCSFIDDEYVEITEYVYDDKWKIVNNFNSIEIPYSPFEGGEGENSAVLNGGENQAISEYSVALGNKNLTGLKGYYYKCIDFENLKIYLSKEQPTSFNSLINVSDLSNEDIEKDIEFNYQIGDVISIVNGPKYYDSSVITNILDGVVIVDTLPFDSYNDPEAIGFDDFSICCLTKPQIGLCDLGKFSIANGYGNQALFFAAHSEGVDNKSIGHYSHTEGESNTAYYAAHAEGWKNIAKGMCSHTEGYGNIANGKYSHIEGYRSITNGEYSHAEGHRTETIGNASHAEGSSNKSIGANSHAEGSSTESHGISSHAEGYQSIATGNYSHAEGQATSSLGKASHSEGRNSISEGEYSHAEGYQTITSNQAEHAEGKFNVSNVGSTIHSVGIGTLNSKRKNAHEITIDGKHYIYNLGGYDGKNLSSSTDLVTYVKSLETRIKELEDIISQITEKI